MTERLVTKPAEKDLFVISYKGMGFAVRIGDNSLRELLKLAEKSLKEQEKKSNGRQEKRKAVRSKEG